MKTSVSHKLTNSKFGVSSLTLSEVTSENHPVTKGFQGLAMQPVYILADGDHSNMWGMK